MAAVFIAVLVAACGGGGSGSTAPTAAASAPGGAPSAAVGGAAGSPAAAGQPIANHGPVGWNRGPYDLAGGTYRIDWESDGSCTALYFGIVGATNGYKETPSTIGDVAVKDMKKGSRTIADVPAGSYFFNVSNLACKTYTATLTPVQ